MNKIAAFCLLGIVLTSAKTGYHKNPLKIKDTVRITDSFTMKGTEVTLEEWMDFIVNHDFDSGLFPDSSKISAPAAALLDDLKKGSNFKYFDIIKTYSVENTFWGLLRVRFKKVYSLDESRNPDFFSPRIPVTGISFAQAQAFCRWREEMINTESRVPLHIALPTIEMYRQTIPNRDSVNPKGCYMYNVLDCHCEVNSKESLKQTTGKYLQSAVWFWPDDNGLYNLQGNAAEMTSTEGIAMGGSFRQYARQTFRDSQQLYDGPQDWLGFRYVVTLK